MRYFSTIKRCKCSKEKQTVTPIREWGGGGDFSKRKEKKTKLYLNFENLVGINEMVEYSSAG